MSMIRIIAHREEAPTLEFGFRKQIPPDGEIVSLEAFRIERRTGQVYEDVTAEIFNLVDGLLPDFRLSEDKRGVLVRKLMVQPEDTEQLQGDYVCQVRVLARMGDQLMVLDADGRSPILRITDGR